MIFFSKHVNMLASNVTPACSFMTLFNQMHTNRSFDVYAITVYETLTFSSLLIDCCKHSSQEKTLSMRTELPKDYV